MGYRDRTDEMIAGEITGLEPEFLAEDVPMLTVRGYDRRHRLMRCRKTHSFLKMKDSDIASQIARDASLTPRTEDTAVMHDYVLQHNQTDLEFLAERAARIGYEVVVDDTTLYFRPPQNTGSEAVLSVLAGTLVWVQRSSPAPPEPPTVALTAFTAGADRQSQDVAAASSEALSHMLLAGTFAPRLDWPASATQRARADFILSGDVRKISRGLVAVVQLHDRASGTVVFSRQYSVSEAQAAALPERIGAEMSSNVSGALAMLVLDRRRPVGHRNRIRVRLPARGIR
jgi:hypothetical protein